MPDLPEALNTPPEIDFHKAEAWKSGDDPAKRVPYSRFRHKLPKLTCQGKTFVWPLGAEGFSRSGSSTLGIHKYIGRHYVDVHVIHSDEAHIEMKGTFAGLTSVKNMQDLSNIIAMFGPKFLYVPGVFPHIQTVYVVDYNFDHPQEDRTHSIDYTISFIRTTTGAKVNDNQTVSNAQTNSIPTNEKGANVSTTSERVVTTTESMQTLRNVSEAVYGDADKWRTLVDLNSGTLVADNSSRKSPQITLPPDYLIPIMRLPIGLRLRY